MYDLKIDWESIKLEIWLPIKMIVVSYVVSCIKMLAVFWTGIGILYLLGKIL